MGWEDLGHSLIDMAFKGDQQLPTQDDAKKEAAKMEVRPVRPEPIQDVPVKPVSSGFEDTLHSFVDAGKDAVKSFADSVPGSLIEKAEALSATTLGAIHADVAVQVGVSQEVKLLLGGLLIVAAVEVFVQFRR